MQTLQVPTVGELERSSGRNNNYLIIRLVAAAAVIYGHSYHLSPSAGCKEALVRYLGCMWSGGVAVYAFFIISGFLVTASYLHRNSLVDYLSARVLRIMPGLLVCLLLTTCVLGPLVSTVSLRQYMADPQTKDYLVNNLCLISTRYHLPGIFAGNPDRAMNGPLWSLLLEVRMYLVLGVLGMLGLIARKRMYNVVVSSLIIVGTFEPRAFSFMTDNSNDLACCCLFALGSLIYVNRDQVPLDGRILGLFFFLAVLFYDTNRFQVAWCGLLTYGVIWLAYVPKLPWFHRMGDYSYGVYIYGWPVAQVVRMYLPTATPMVNTMLSVPITLGIAMLSWHLVEKPALSLKRYVPRVSLGRLLNWQSPPRTEDPADAEVLLTPGLAADSDAGRRKHAA
jgi:peptidoglycan/LPS O-acetylase OafA/YrhL